MFLASLVAAHDPAKVSRGGLIDRPVIFMQFGALHVSCSVDDARTLAADLVRVANEAGPQADCAVDWTSKHNFAGIQRGNADLVPAEHATLGREHAA